MSYYEKVKNIKPKTDAVILGIESSCDDTCCAIVRGGNTILANEIISSAAEHAKYGGVVPEIASRMHTDAISKVVQNALKTAKMSFDDIDAVAVTYGAGLLGALLVGLSYAKALAMSLNIPLIAVSHIRGHISASYLGNDPPNAPFVSMLSSGGHTAVIYIPKDGEFQIMGQTLDDAIGEAFDKVARTLKLGYPGGPEIERAAKGGENSVVLPKMLKGNNGFDLSYSGLKTAVINYVHNREQTGKEIDVSNVAFSFQKNAVDALIERAIRAAKQCNVKEIACGGGVAANTYLRESISEKCRENNFKLHLPEKKLCTDNAAMICAEGYFKYMKGDYADLLLNAESSL